MAHKLEP